MNRPLPLIAATLLSLSTALAQAPATPTPAPAATPGAATGPRPATAATPAPRATQSGTNAPGRPPLKHLPFQGPVKFTDTNAMTVTLSVAQNQERVLRLDGESRLIKGGKPAVLADIAPGDFARGVVHKDNKGEDVIASATFGPRPVPKPKAPAQRPATGTKPAQAKPAGAPGAGAQPPSQ